MSIQSITEEMMRVGKTFILESNFVKESISILSNLIEKYDYHCITMRFEADLKLLHKRFLEREVSNERHQGLVSNGVFNKFEEFKKTADKSREFKISNQEILVDTTDFLKVNFSEIMDKIYEEIKREYIKEHGTW